MKIKTTIITLTALLHNFAILAETVTPSEEWQLLFEALEKK